MVPKVLATANVVVKFLNKKGRAGSKAVDVRLQIAESSSNGEETPLRFNSNGPLGSGVNRRAGDCRLGVRCNVLVCSIRHGDPGDRRPAAILRAELVGDAPAWS
jgi:hypothetical protein